MTEKPLIEKRKEIFDLLIKKCPTIAGRVYRIIRQQDAEAVNNSKRRIKEVIQMEWKKGMGYILKEIEEIYIEEFGEKLIK